jgi:hypothetical protein
MRSTKDDLVASAEALGAIVVRRSGSIVIVLAGDAAPSGDDLLSLEDCREITRDRTTRQIREAIASADLHAVGRQRSRLVKRRDLMAWIEGRQAKPVSGVVDADILRRMDRLARSKKRSAA